MLLSKTLLFSYQFSIDFSYIRTIKLSHCNKYALIRHTWPFPYCLLCFFFFVSSLSSFFIFIHKFYFAFELKSIEINNCSTWQIELKSHAISISNGLILVQFAIRMHSFFLDFDSKSKSRGTKCFTYNELRPLSLSALTFVFMLCCLLLLEYRCRLKILHLLLWPCRLELFVYILWESVKFILIRFWFVSRAHTATSGRF